MLQKAQKDRGTNRKKHNARNPTTSDGRGAEPHSNGDAYQSVHEAYVLPGHKRPGSSPSSAAAIAVVVLGGDDPDRTVKQIIDAGWEFGVFQVINHGVPEQVLSEMMSSAEFFEPVPGVLVVNFGHQMEVVINGVFEYQTA